MYTAMNFELRNKVDEKVTEILEKVEQLLEKNGEDTWSVYKLFTPEEMGMKPRLSKEDIEKFTRCSPQWAKQHAPLSEEKLNFLRSLIGEPLLSNLRDALLCTGVPDTEFEKEVDAAALRLLEV